MTDLTKIDALDKILTKKYKDKLEVNYDLDRTLVSFQANKTANEHRWCKYKEGFSAELIRYILQQLDIQKGHLLDPFVGSGTALFTASEEGLDATGIELLPSSAEIIEVRASIQKSDRAMLADQIRRFSKRLVWEKPGKVHSISHMPITKGAYSEESLHSLERYLFECEKLTDKKLGRVLRFAAMCILESISFTRKDGQYLRWDYRSGRSLNKKKFDKGKIFEFTEAITQKLCDIANDLDQKEMLFPVENERIGNITLKQGSCLEIMPELKTSSFDVLITSPPYCNRYDYTRTYALELAMLGVGEEEIKQLRQTMLSCTVENRAKESLSNSYVKSRFQKAIDAFENQEMLQAVLGYLDDCKVNKTINNTGIPRMVRNYFLELTVLISEWARVLKPGAPLVMVNDNVRYEGAHVPVDLILSDIAKNLGFEIERIWVLPKGKGNSSQQMGKHGRTEIRKCVYIWRMPTKARKAKKLNRQAVAAQ